ncbi:MAG: hypothetical protein ABSF73_02430 [Terriglobia bacterium]
MVCKSQPVEFSQTEILHIDVWPEGEGEIVEFRLVYKGRLPSQGSGDVSQAKHEIRLAVHEQLQALWREHPVLKAWSKLDSISEGERSDADVLADNYQRCNMRFLPLVSNRSGLACALDIIFLRRDPPGTPIITGGDIDNRLKVLLDGLKMPKESGHLPRNWEPGPTHDPMYCLMEDDNLITEIKVTSDRLLAPLAEEENKNDVELVIHVTTKIIKPLILSIGGAPQL